MPDFSVTGEAALKALARDLRAVGDEGKGIRKELRKEIVAAVQPMKRAAQANVLATPASGGNHSGLRRAIAKAIRVRVKIAQGVSSVRLEVDPKKMPPDQTRLGGRMEGAGRPWRHPVFGDTNDWVTQRSHPYFNPAVDAHLKGVQDGIDKAIRTATAALRNGR